MKRMRKLIRKKRRSTLFRETDSALRRGRLNRESFKS